jgi:hypothetical protein
VPAERQGVAQRSGAASGASSHLIIAALGMIGDNEGVAYSGGLADGEADQVICAATRMTRQCLSVADQRSGADVGGCMDLLRGGPRAAGERAGAITIDNRRRGGHMHRSISSS